MALGSWILSVMIGNRLADDSTHDGVMSPTNFLIILMLIEHIL